MGLAGSGGRVPRAVELDPSYSVAQCMLGHVLSQMGRQDEALAAMRRSRELEPLNPMNHALSARIALQGRDYSAGCRPALQCDPAC